MSTGKQALQDKVSLMTPEEKRQLLREYAVACHVIEERARKAAAEARFDELAKYCGYTEVQRTRILTSVSAQMQLVDQMLQTAMAT